MCRCCQSCWEDIYWNCFEERFCYDKSIANYNPDDDEQYIVEKNGSALGHMQTVDNNNLPVCNQPLRRGNSTLSAKIHEEDYKRETQINVPMLGPEILAVFANSQIFQDHQPTKLNRISTRTYLAGVHAAKDSSAQRDNDQDKLIKRLEENLDEAVDIVNRQLSLEQQEKRITFTITSDSSPEDTHSLTPKKFEPITEEIHTPSSAEQPVIEAPIIPPAAVDELDEVVLRPRLIDRHPHLKLNISPPKRQLRSAQSVPHFNVRPVSSETDIFTITGSTSRISMTPEVPSISFSNLPKNYEDTPTIEKYKVSQSLYSIQTANAARAFREDYSMPRYFTNRRSGAIQRSETFVIPTSSSDDITPRKMEKEKSKRLKALRESLPPLLIPSIRKKDETKQLD